MAVKLIQASNNTSNGIPIFTFYFEYVRRNRLFDVLGLTKIAAVREWLTSRYYATGTDLNTFFERARQKARQTERVIIANEVCQVIVFCNKIFKAVSDPKGRISIEDIKKAASLFGPDLQSVLKQRSVGDFHNPVVYGSDSWHRYEATADGWRAV